MKRTTRNGAAALVQALQAAGIGRLFTLSGNHIMPVYDAALDAGVELIHVRHEAAAVHMADAWARLTGETGVALVTGGPGHANAVGALYTAAMAESPVLLLSGHAPLNRAGMGAFQEMRQADIAAPLAKGSRTSAAAGQLAADVGEALVLATSGRPGPVHLSLPQDVLEGEAGAPLPRPDSPIPRTRESSRSAHLPDLAFFTERLHRARRPLILGGPSILTRRAREPIARLEEACGIPVIGMESPRGIADPGLGAFAQVLKQADCILLLGKKLDFTLRFGEAPAIAAECEFLQIDPEEAEIERTRRAVGKRLVAEAVMPLSDAIDALAARPPARAASWRDEVRAAVARRPGGWLRATAAEPGRLHPAQALYPLQEILDSHPDSVFVSDGGEFGQWAQACLAAPNRVVNGVAGSIGAGLPFAAAARLARPDAPVIAVMGDGTFGFHPAEIDTAVRYNLPFVAIVGNDARWNAEYQIQVREYGAHRAVATQLLATRYDEVARGFGGYGERVTEAAALRGAVARALESRLPAVIDVMIDGLPAPELSRI